MDRLESSYPPASTLQTFTKMTESTFQTSPSATESTFQASDRTYFAEQRINNMTYEVEYTDEFEQWWLTLDEATQDEIDIAVELLQEWGPNLRFPQSSGVQGTRHPRMRELRVQHKGNPYRILYVFDPRRVAVLLLGGSKVGNDRWYEENVPKADRLYDELLQELENEGLI